MTTLKMMQQKAIVHEGNVSRLNAILQRGIKGEPLTIGFIGGSITQGCASTKPENSYAQTVFRWFETNLPNASLTYVNAAIGGTNSIFGVHRVDKDLLEHKPDVVFVEYSVNDMEGSAINDFEKPYEALLYKILAQKNNPQVIVFNTMKLDDGTNTQEAHNRIAKSYDLPCISVKNGLWDDIRSGQVDFRCYGQDELHPNDTGHAVYASLLIGKLDTVLENLKGNEIKDKEISSQESLTKEIMVPRGNCFIHATKLTNTEIAPLSNNGWTFDDQKVEYVGDLFKQGWKTDRPEASIIFEFEASCVYLQYKHMISELGGMVKVKIRDVNESSDYEAIVLEIDANFVDGWGDTLKEIALFKSDSKVKKTIEIIMQNNAEKCKNYFYVSAFFVS